DAFGGRLQQVAINALVGNTLYASATIAYGKRARMIDLRLADALVLAVREDAPIFISRALFEASVEASAAASAARDLADADAHGAAAEPLAGGKTRRTMERDDRLRREEAARQQDLAARQRHTAPLWERLWTMMLISLAGSSDALSRAELRDLDPAA